jgi:hypothetical protein
MLAVNDLCTATIIENGYWKGEAKGKIVGETAKFWIVESSRFDKGSKRFSKTGGNVAKRQPKAA